MSAGASEAVGELRSLDGPLRVSRDARTGYVTFIGTKRSDPIPRIRGASASASPREVATNFVSEFGDAFGPMTSSTELVPRSATHAPGGEAAVRFQQEYRGVSVLGGELVVNVNRQGRVISANGELMPRAPDVPEAKLSARDAIDVAKRAVERAYGIDRETLTATSPRTTIYDSRLLGWQGLGIPTLTWRVEVTANPSLPLDVLVLVDARQGAVALQFNQVAEALTRRVCDANNTTTQVPCVSPVRTEGGPASGIADVNAAYDLTGDVFDFYFSRFGRDSFDDDGSAMTTTTRYCPALVYYGCPMNNGYWNGSQIVMGAGQLADDFVGHEWTHAVTQYTSDLMYLYQSGAINESLSDVMGEFVDLTNGTGTDTSSTRWEMFEDAGVSRSMKDPPAFDQPDRMTSPLYQADADIWDSGGVHHNSGVNNKAVYLMTDGGNFNGHDVTGIGITKVARIYYEVMTNYLTSASDYADLADGLTQACSNLIGTAGITAADCGEVSDAISAVEMTKEPPNALAPDSPTCETGSPVNAFFDDMEDPEAGNWIEDGDEGHWFYPEPSSMPPYAKSGKHSLYGRNYWDVGDYSIQMAEAVTVPEYAYLRFAHAYLLEHDLADTYDGGVVEYSVDGGAWRDAGPLFIDNAYNGTISAEFDNPLGGREGFVGSSNGYVSSRLDLAGLAGSDVRFRFRIGTDGALDSYGWWIDDVRLYRCDGETNPPSDTAIPVAAAPGPELSYRSLLGIDPGARSIPIRVSWPAGSDDRTAAGNLRYRLEEQVNGGTWGAVTDWVSARSLGIAIRAGDSYRYRVTARDQAAKLSAPAVGPSFVASIRQENDSSISYASGWEPRRAVTSAFGGYLRGSGTVGAAAVTQFSADSYGVVIPTYDSLGIARICLRDAGCAIR
ncbi:MAG: M4 family metallopeptidase, partial [Microbacteriaceae bacterium]|nr:M4 family metallopeptidase [Microbacteriaceae bacterium]